ncbi:hypothetical protein GUJ93_ZPchr0013g36384 [Zizania palustris]|uniref:Uncharacterized protein n=1 Tax=Zizania palustris TaxID=103762 RepID=A0A8J6C0Q9_ZIZPA|nr:hypothetical protein GUJ93_ZPchr0013g36384 [Zizania palustris]
MANAKFKPVADWSALDPRFLSDPRFLYTPEELIVDFPSYFSILQRVHEQANTREFRFGDDVVAGEIEEEVLAKNDDDVLEEAAIIDAAFSHIVDLIEELLEE